MKPHDLKKKDKDKKKKKSKKKEKELEEIRASISSFNEECSDKYRKTKVKKHEKIMRMSQMDNHYSRASIYEGGIGLENRPAGNLNDMEDEIDDSC